MALPPIISNLPIVKLFKSDSSGAQAAEKPASANATQPTDIVEISEAAQKKLAEAGDKAVTNESAARRVAGEIKIILDSNDEATLGLDPQFVREESA